MKKKTVGKAPASLAKEKQDGFSPLIAEVRRLIQSARQGVATTVNAFQVLTNFEIGRRIVEHEQKGEPRAEYGAALLKALSTRLTEEFGRGFSRPNLEYMRKFYLLWQERRSQVSQPTAGKWISPVICQKASDKLKAFGVESIWGRAYTFNRNLTLF